MSTILSEAQIQAIRALAEETIDTIYEVSGLETEELVFAAMARLRQEIIERTAGREDIGLSE